MQSQKDQRNSTKYNQNYLKRIQSITKLSTIILLSQETFAVETPTPSMTQNIFSNIHSLLKTQQHHRYANVPTWQGALVVVALVGIPFCLSMGVLAVRAKAVAAGRAEAKNLGRELSENNDCDDTTEDKLDNNAKGEDSNKQAEDDAIKEAIEQQLDENAAPLHLNMRISARLKGSINTSSIKTRGRVLSRSSSRGSSRSASPAPELQSHSSSSSLAEELWAAGADILTDKKGFEELEPIPPHAMVVLSKLPAVSERLCEETLEDVHAFSDLVANRERTGSTRSLTNNIPSSDNSYLETLDEEGDDFFDENEESSPIPTIMEDGNTQVVFDLLDTGAKTTTVSTTTASEQ